MGSTSRFRPRGRARVGAAVLAGLLLVAGGVLFLGLRDDDTPVAFGDGQRPPARVEVVVTAADWIPGTGAEIAGYVSGVVETGGECTFTLERGGVRLETTRPATADATTTACGWLQIDDPQVTSGTWTATLGYRSTETTASSPDTPLDVP